MAKVALLIGASEYQPGLNPLPGSVKDMEAMQQVLQQPEIGGFDEVRMLPNPELQAMQEAIETLFSGRTKDDLVLLFFSGHGVRDDNGRLYFATRITRKNSKGELIKSTAVPASFVHDMMSNSRSRRQVVILDCCFSGAFAEGLSAKDDGSIDIKNQLGGEGRAVLTSSTATQYSFEQQGSALSIYTRYLVEGMKTGAADRDKDGLISIDDLHEYAKEKVEQAAPAMKPEIYTVKEGFKILLAKAPTDDPNLKYRQQAQQLASRGEFSPVGRLTLSRLRADLKLLPEEADAIEAEVLQPYQERRKKLQEYEQAFVDAIQHEYPLPDYTRNELKNFQQILSLRDEDVETIEARTISGRESTPANPEASSTNPVRFESKDVGEGNQTSSVVENNRAVKSVPTESVPNNLRSEQRVNSTMSSTSQPQSLSEQIIKNKNKLLAGGTVFLIGLVGFLIYMQVTSLNPRYTRLQELLSAGKWKEADEETAQQMSAVASRQKEQGLREEDFNNFPCNDLKTIDNLWVTASKQHFGLSVQRSIWESSDVNSDFDKFLIRVKWAHQKNNGPSFDYYYLMDGFAFNLTEPKGHLPWAPTYYGGSYETRKAYMSRIISCGI